MSINSKMTALADEVRTISGITSPMSLDVMTSTLQTENTNFESNLTEQSDLISQITTLVATKSAPSSGIDTSDATATADDILSGKTAYAEGAKITGTIATKTASDLSVSGATVTVPAGYYASEMTRSVSIAEQAVPSISVLSDGRIVATSAQSEGYVAEGTRTATKQLSTQSSKTVTPTTTNQTAVAKGVYTTGAVTVTGDANLVADNIKSGVSIFGVAGSYAGSGGSGGDMCTATISVAGQMAVFGYGSCDVYVPAAGDSFAGTQQLPSTEHSSHLAVGLAVKRVFNNVPVGSVFTIYSSTNSINGVSTEGDVEFAYANHSATTVTKFQFLVCRFNGTGTITVT